jgi:hypothetical protein
MSSGEENKNSGSRVNSSGDQALEIALYRSHIEEVENFQSSQGPRHEEKPTETVESVLLSAAPTENDFDKEVHNQLVHEVVGAFKEFSKKKSRLLQPQSSDQVGCFIRRI